MAACFPSNQRPCNLAQVWHEGPGLGSWCLERIELESRLRGLLYRFYNSERGGWITRGRKHAVVLRPAADRLGEAEELLQVRRRVLAALLPGLHGAWGEDAACVACCIRIVLRCVALRLKRFWCRFPAWLEYRGIYVRSLRVLERQCTRRM